MRQSGAPPARSSGFRDYGPLAPKPFDFVPLAEARRRADVAGHDKFVLTKGTHSGRLYYQLVALNHVFVSSGQYALSEDVGTGSGGVVRGCYRVTVDGKSTPAIPGASLKGAIRSIVEAVTASCVSVTRADRHSFPRPESARLCRPEALCPACALFGTMSRLARLSFGDATLTTGRTVLYRLPPLYRPRLGQARRVYQDTRGLYKGRKFYFHGRRVEHKRGSRVEVIPEKSVLAGSLDFENLSDDEVGLLFFALGLDGTFRPMLGGGKPVCLGSVEFRPVALEWLGLQDLLQYQHATQRLEAEGLKAFVAQRVAGAQTSGLILAPQRDRLRKILDPHNQRPAPEGMY